MRIIYILLLFVSWQTNAQNEKLKDFSSDPNVDNLEILLSMEGMTEEDFTEAKKLYKNYSSISLDTAQLIIDKMVELANQDEESILFGEALNLLGRTLRKKGDYENAEINYEKAKAIGIKLNNDKFTASVIYEMAWLANNKEQYDLALNRHLETLALYQKLDDSSSLFNSYYSIAGVYFNMKFMGKVQEYIGKATAIAESKNDSGMKRQIYNASSNIFNGIAERFSNMAETDSINRKMYEDSVQYFCQLGIESSLKAYELIKGKQNYRGEAINLVHLIGGYNNIKDYEKSLAIGKEAKKVLDRIGNDELNSQYNNYMAVACMMSGKPELALGHAEESLRLSEMFGRERIIANSHDYLHRVHFDLGNYKKALEHLMEYHKYLKKISDLDKSNIIAEAEAKFQTVEKEKQILSQENEILALESTNASIEKQRNLILGLGLIGAILAFFGFRMNKLRKDRNDKKAFSEALIGAQEEERKKIARDLHDGIGQSLLLIQKQMEKSDETISQNQLMIAETLEEVRALSRDLHPFQLDKFGLTTTVEDTIQKVSDNSDLFITQELVNIDDVIPKASAIHVFRTIQEALSNIVKHAEASAAKVTFSINNSDVLISIQDNGKGFDSELAIVKLRSLGLKTMQERISTVGGKFKIEKGNPKGTIISIIIPKTAA